MKKLILSLSVLFLMNTGAADLKEIMSAMGKDFKLSFRLAIQGDSSDQAKKTVKRLKENILLASSTLPSHVDPTDEVTVEKYQSIMNRLLQEADDLVVIFDTEPLNKREALMTLKTMDNIRKEGHSVFR